MNKRVLYSILAGGATLLIYNLIKGYRALRIALSSYQITRLNISSGTLGLNLYFDITNPLLIGVTLREISGKLIATNRGQEPVVIGEVYNRYNYYIRGNARHMIRAEVLLSTQAIAQQVLQNIQSGNVQNLLITFDGALKFGKDTEVSLPISRNMTITELLKHD